MLTAVIDQMTQVSGLLSGDYVRGWTLPEPGPALQSRHYSQINNGTRVHKMGTNHCLIIGKRVSDTMTEREGEERDRQESEKDR